MNCSYVCTVQYAPQNTEERSICSQNSSNPSSLITLHLLMSLIRIKNKQANAVTKANIARCSDHSTTTALTLYSGTSVIIQKASSRTVGKKTARKIDGEEKRVVVFLFLSFMGEACTLPSVQELRKTLLEHSFSSRTEKGISLFCCAIRNNVMFSLIRSRWSDVLRFEKRKAVWCRSVHFRHIFFSFNHQG